MTEKKPTAASGRKPAATTAKRRTRTRSSRTGEFVKPAEAKRDPAGTVVETVAAPPPDNPFIMGAVAVPDVPYTGPTE